MVGIRHGKNIQRHISGIANGAAHAQADLGPTTSKLAEAAKFRLSDVSRDDIGPCVKTFRSALRRSRRGISRAVAQKQKQREREVTHYSLHDPPTFSLRTRL